MKEWIYEQTNKEWKNKSMNKWTNKKKSIYDCMNKQEYKNESMNKWTNNEQTRMKELIYDRMNKQE